MLVEVDGLPLSLSLINWCELTASGHTAARTAFAGIGQQSGLDTTESDRDIGLQDRPVHFARVGVNTTGNITGHHARGTELLQAGNQLRSGPAQPTPGTCPEQGVDDDVAAGSHDGQLFGVAGFQAEHPATRSFERSQPFRMGRVRGAARM